MALLNYTTTISVEKTFSEIQRMLIKAGAKSVRSDFDDRGNTVAVSFLIVTQFGERAYQLPANVEMVWRTLTKQRESGHIRENKFATREQAARVAWRVIKDWLEAQLAIIETQMVTLDQIFLPYMLTDSGQTLYLAMVERQLALPAPRVEANS